MAASPPNTQTPQSQQVTQELRRWIIAQAEAGYSPQVVLQSMMKSGWDEDVAIAAMESTLQRHLDNRRQPLDLPPALDVPEPKLQGAPLYVDAGDRQVPVLAALTLPRVVVFGELLSAAECDALITAATPRLSRSLTVATQTGDTEINEDRTSDGMFFERGETKLIQRLEQRIARLLNWPVDHGENLQILHYVPGTEYKAHYDYFEPDHPGTPAILERGGQRVATLVIYLNEPERGGATRFPDVGLDVMPKRGNAVFFSYPRPHPSTHTLHAGTPVLAGDKWIATKWLRERPFV